MTKKLNNISTVFCLLSKEFGFVPTSKDFKPQDHILKMLTAFNNKSWKQEGRRPGLVTTNVATINAYQQLQQLLVQYLVYSKSSINLLLILNARKTQISIFITRIRKANMQSLNQVPGLVILFSIYSHQSQSNSSYVFVLQFSSN